MQWSHRADKGGEKKINKKTTQNVVVYNLVENIQKVDENSLEKMKTRMKMTLKKWMERSSWPRDRTGRAASYRILARTSAEPVLLIVSSPCREKPPERSPRSGLAGPIAPRFLYPVDPARVEGW